jgi:hypothetical protein
LKIQAAINAGTMMPLPDAPETLTHWEFAALYGFDDYAYSDKFDRVIETVTDMSEDVVVL